MVTQCVLREAKTEFQILFIMNFVFRIVSGVLLGQKQQTYVQTSSTHTICNLGTVNWKTHSFRCVIYIRDKTNLQSMKTVQTLPRWGGDKSFITGGVFAYACRLSAF